MPGIFAPGPEGVGSLIQEGGDARWAGLTHEEIWALVQQGDPVAASEGASLAWMKTQVLIQDIEQRLGAVVAGTAADWDGSAAVAARGSMTRLGQWAVEGVAGAQNIGRALQEQSHEATYVRTHMPAPRTQELDAGWDRFWNGPVDVTQVLDRLGDLHALEAQIDNDAQRARELMTQYEARSHELLPRMQDMTPPPEVTVGIGPAGAPSGGAGVTTAGLGAAGAA
ncbi:MAG: hypothetical protein ACRDXB_20130, partial [Actinomycetes bacterium]